MIYWKMATTHAEKNLCYRLRARGYGRYYRNIPEDRFIDPLDKDTLPDGSPRAYNTMVYDDDELVATGRLSSIITPHDTSMHSEIDFLFHLDADLPELIRRSADENYQPRIVGEMARFTSFNTRNKDATILAIFGGLLNIAKMTGVEVIVGLMRGWMAERVGRAGVTLQRVQGCHLNLDNPQALRYLVRYRDYFLPGLDKHLPQGDISDDELRAIVDHYFPEPNIGVYWVGLPHIERALDKQGLKALA